MDKYIKIKGARTHNLKNIDLDLPKNNLITITGLSGSGKSSLAFDTIFAEGQRRYVESLSAYARQFLSMVDKPDPAISIEQKSTSHNPRSTVGTVTEIHDYLRLLYARIGEPKCPEHNVGLDAMSTSDIYQKLIETIETKTMLILSPIVRQQKGEHIKTIQSFSQQGYSRVRVNSKVHKINDISKHMLGHIIDPKKKNDIELLIDRVEVNEMNKLRIIESLNSCSEISDGIIFINEVDNNKNISFQPSMLVHTVVIQLVNLNQNYFHLIPPRGHASVVTG